MQNTDDVGWFERPHLCLSLPKEPDPFMYIILLRLCPPRWVTSRYSCPRATGAKLLLPWYPFNEAYSRIGRSLLVTLSSALFESSLYQFFAPWSKRFMKKIWDKQLWNILLKFSASIPKDNRSANFLITVCFWPNYASLSKLKF